MDWATIFAGAQAVATVCLGIPTLWFLRKYTLETIRLREQAEHQLEAQYTPIIALRDVEETRPAEQVIIENIGNGHAFEVQVEPLETSTRTRKFVPIFLLKAGATTTILADSPTPPNEGQEATAIKAALYAIRGSAEPITIQCKSISGLIYRYRFRQELHSKRPGVAFVLDGYSVNRPKSLNSTSENLNSN